MLLTVPLALLAISGLLGLAAVLEERRAKVLVRLAVRSNATPEAAEALIASELAPLLHARGLDERPETPPGRSAAA